MALRGLEADRAKLDEEITEIKLELRNAPVAAPPDRTATSATPAKKRRKMSAEARRRISEGMKRRYAELKKAAKAARK